MSVRHRFALLCVFGLAFLAPACAGATTHVRLRVVDTGSLSDGGFDPGPSRILRDASSARALLSAWGAPPRTIARVGAIDFGRRSLIVLLGGWMADPGYVLLPGVVTLDGGMTQVYATLFSRRGGSASVVARPWTLVSVPRDAVAAAGPEVALDLHCSGPRACRALAVS
jgi:hypothetical protein